jgi:cold shock protein
MSATDDERTIGKVKWFNNKAGYGFVTVSSGQHAEKDIFVHYSNINVSSSQYKYLVQGEYIEFLVSPTDGSHEFQATNISGINGGTIMCETRSMSRDTERKPRRQNDSFATVEKKERT